ncbi:TetR/AcrR family transcriptional regulator [Paenibacillus sp. SN-8-1]|uniref:TetR/AcrR family transcriptional regulator n=1 Tax=Paenibacillus sp. SN-8-1 TaxID=3435409 RepID=UPI003D9A4E12
MNKKQLQSEQTKKKVADSARTLFVQKGYARTSIEDIVAETGSSKGNIYYHFKSKEGLFLYLIDEWERDWDQKWRSKESQFKTIKEKMYGFAEHMVIEDLNHPLTKAAQEFFNNNEMENDIEDRISKLMNSHIEFNKRLIQELVDSNNLSSAQMNGLAVIFESLFIGLNHMSKKLEMQEALVLYKQAVDIFLHGTEEYK